MRSLIRLPLLFAILGFAALSPANAQSHAADNIINGAPLNYPANEPYNPHNPQEKHNAAQNLRPLPTYYPPSGWTAATAPNPTYPLRITLEVVNQDSVGRAIQGDGTLRVEGANPAPLSYHYACVLSLASDTTYQARWIKPRHKLQVLLVDPKGHHATCRLSTSTYTS